MIDTKIRSFAGETLHDTRSYPQLTIRHVRLEPLFRPFPLYFTTRRDDNERISHLLELEQSLFSPRNRRRTIHEAVAVQFDLSSGLAFTTR